MHLFALSSLWLLFTSLPAVKGLSIRSDHDSHGGNSTSANPILPGFHPDPSCIFVKEWDETFFCASSSFNAFPGIPIHASKDLQHWKLIGHALNRREQLPELVITNKSTSGIWAPAIRYHDGTFYILTTLVNDEQPQTNFSRWDNIIFSSDNPYSDASWTDPVHFKAVGYDCSPWWEEDGTSYVVWAHAFHIEPGIRLATLDLKTGAIGEEMNPWNGTGGPAPEGPHLYKKDGYYYLMIAEGGTGFKHMETIGRSKDLGGPYESDPANPILTNANTTEWFQTVGHADIFQDARGQYWGVALSTRAGTGNIFPMGRETVMTAVSWEKGQWPVFTQVRGEESVWRLPATNLDVPGAGQFIDEPDVVDFAPGSVLPKHFTYWRPPIEASYTISPPGHPNTLRLLPSKLNLTALNGNYAGPEGQTFVGRRQVDSYFRFSATVDYAPQEVEEEAGVTVFLTQDHHIDFGVVGLQEANTSDVVPHFRVRSESFITVAAPLITPVPEAWRGKPLVMEIKQTNQTHYVFSAGPEKRGGGLQTIGYGDPAAVSWGYTGKCRDMECY